MVTLFTMLMLVLAVIVIFGCISGRRVPNSILEWVILIVAIGLLFYPGK